MQNEDVNEMSSSEIINASKYNIMGVRVKSYPFTDLLKRNLSMHSIKLSS